MNSEGFVSCQHLLRPESLVFSVLQRQARGEKAYTYSNTTGVRIFNVKSSLTCMLGSTYCMFEFNSNTLYPKKYCTTYISCRWRYDEKKITVYFATRDIVCNDLNPGIF